MINKTIFFLAAGVMATMASMPASAQWYVGGALGATKSKVSDSALPISGSTASSLSKDESASVYGLGVGYDLNRTWSLEGGYTSNGKIGGRRTSTAGTVGTFGAESTGYAWYGTGIGKLPLQDKFYLFGKLGLARTTTKTNLDTTGAVTLPAGTNMNRKHSEFNLLWGLGVGYDINRSVGLRLDYTQVKNVGNTNTGEGNIHSFTAGIGYRF